MIVGLQDILEKEIRALEKEFNEGYFININV